MMRVLVLLGGDSPERLISIASGHAVSEACAQNGYAVRVLDVRQPVATILEYAHKVDIVFPVLHGIGGEDGTIQALLEQEHIPFVGNGAEASRRCFDKWRYKQLLATNNLPTPQGNLVTKKTFRADTLATKPFVLKPCNGGSSIDTYVVRDVTLKALNDCEAAFTRHDTMLLETLITGTEITVGVLCGQALPVIEIIPPQGKEFDLENKYNGATQELCPPQHIDARLQQAAQAAACTVEQVTGCQDMSRTDMIIDRNGTIFILETNTIPGMTAESLFPKAARQAGYTMPQLVNALVSAVKTKHHSTTS